MPASDTERDQGFSSQWPGEDPRQPQASSSSYRYLLDLDDDMAQEFDLRMRVVARQVATAVVMDVPAGAQDVGGVVCRHPARVWRARGRRRARGRHLCR